MSDPIPVAGAPSSGRRAVIPELVWAVATVAIAVCFFSPVRQLADPTLDHSNYASYALFTAREYQYGSEVVPMAGPLGFVPYGFLYAGHLYWKRLPLELLTKLVLAGLVVWFVRRSPGSLVRWAWLAAVLFMTPLVDDLCYDLAILLGGLCLLENSSRPGRLRVSCALAAFLAFLTLFKGTQALLALATFGLLALQAVLCRDFRRLPWLAGTYLLALIGFLLLAGQNPLHFPAYLHGVLELSSGYNLAMVLDEPRQAFLSGLGALVALQAMLVLVLLHRWREPAVAACAALLAAFTFVEWKHGFVRADGHVYIFYQYACVAAPAVWLLAFTGNPTAFARPVRIGFAVLAVAAVGLGVWGDGVQSLQRHHWALTELPRHAALAWRQIASPAQTKARLDRELEAGRSAFALPQVSDLVGRLSIDYFGTELGYLTLNRLNYRPRPMGGGNFNVFTPWLRDLNLQHVADPDTRPEFFLARLDTIDERFTAQDDGGTLQALLALYSPVETEQGMVLFRVRPGRPLMPEPRLLATRTLALDQPIDAPEVGAHEMLAIELALPLNLAGRLRSLFYKPPLIFLNLEGEGIEHPLYRRVVPGLFSRPVVFDPVIENTRDLVALYQGEPGKHVRRFQVHTERPGFFARDDFAVRFYAVPRPEVVPEIAATHLQERLKFGVASRVPRLLAPAAAPQRRFDGLLVQMLEPPGRIRFALDGGEKEVRFVFGIDPAAYIGGQTDGVDFLVDLERPGQPTHNLFRRWLRPRTQPEDAGMHAQRVVLPPFPRGSTLSLRTEMGADRDGAWDWAFYSGILLRSGGFLPEQFPRFGRLPVDVDAVMAGVMPFEGRDLFMLNSPGSLSFELQGNEKNLSFRAGLLPGAYTKGGASDGVEFVVELRTPAGEVRRVAQWLLNPRDNGVDRGDRPFAVALPAAPAGSRLILSALPGPAGSDAWDWSYIESLEIR